MALHTHQLSAIFGIVGNIISFAVFLSPIPTFYKIYNRRSSQGYKSLPYVIGLCSASMLLYYGVLKTHVILIVIINSIGCFIESVYLLLYVVYATQNDKVSTLRMIGVLNIGCLGLFLGLSLLLAEGAKRVSIVGWTCAVFSVAVFASPLSIMMKVIRTKSVEFMPVGLSISLTLNATTWFFYGFYLNDYYIAGPNILGFIFGVIQIIIFLIYRNPRKTQEQGEEVEESNADGIEDQRMTPRDFSELELGPTRVHSNNGSID